jgi:hypothetical protein
MPLIILAAAEFGHAAALYGHLIAVLLDCCGEFCPDPVKDGEDSDWRKT